MAARLTPVISGSLRVTLHCTRWLLLSSHTRKKSKLKAEPAGALVDGTCARFADKDETWRAQQQIP